MSVDKSVVGLEDEKEMIKEKLTSGTTGLDVVLIVGMGGIGKTTIARKVYQELEYHFHARAFSCVSQTYDKRELLLEILPQVTEPPSETEELSYQDLGEILCRGLRGKRYLIVMDDVWDIGAWNDLGIFFPNDHNQSRILFTSRQNDVVSQVKHDVPPHCLRLLSEEESWELLEKEAFHQGSCPPDLLDLGSTIAKNCKGLPLAIVVAAGILAKAGEDRNKWKQIAESVSSDAKLECSHIFELSYKYLPQHLKPCFLYLAAFEEDAQISSRRLIQLWIAEGFIPGTEGRCLEDLAEDYLTDLIGRNLVMVSERRSNGGSKSCRLHDLILEFCLRKAREEKFMQRIQGYDWTSAFRGLDGSNPRLCSYYRGEFQKHSKFLFNPYLSSLLLFRCVKQNYLGDYSFISRLKHLTVLDLDTFAVTEGFFDMKLPTQLRYLAVRGDLKRIPPSISRLSKLETLVVMFKRQSTLETIDLPDSIWEMVMLRHLHVDGRNFFKFTDPRGNTLENLQTLSLLGSYGYHTERMLKALPRLRKLKSWLPCDIYPNFGFLSQLESLHLSYFRLSYSYLASHLPSNLKKLTISRSWLSQKDISRFAGILKLEVLKILGGKFKEPMWCMTDDENFQKLKYLKLSQSNIIIWDASSENFPCLEKLVVHHCDKLESIPLSFGEIPTLQWIDVQLCGQSVATSVRQIQEEQKNMGNEELKVHIYSRN